MNSFIELFPIQLSRDIIKIIHNYNDISTEHLFKNLIMYDKVHSYVWLKHDITIIDLIIRSLRRGCHGFYIVSDLHTIGVHLKNEMTHDKRIRYDYFQNKHYFYIENGKEMYYTDIRLLNCLEEK